MYNNGFDVSVSTTANNNERQKYQGFDASTTA